MFWRREIGKKPKLEVIADAGFTNLVFMGNGTFSSKEKGKKIYIRKEWKTYTADFEGVNVVVMVVDKITNNDVMDSFLKNHIIILNQDEWMLLKKK